MITRRDIVIDGVSIFCLRHANIKFHPAFRHRREERVHQTARLPNRFCNIALFVNDDDDASSAPSFHREIFSLLIFVLLFCHYRQSIRRNHGSISHAFRL
jgi:hypothetical protein